MILLASLMSFAYVLLKLVLSLQAPLYYIRTFLPLVLGFLH